MDWSGSLKFGNWVIGSSRNSIFRQCRRGAKIADACLSIGETGAEPADGRNRFCGGRGTVTLGLKRRIFFSRTA